MTRSSLKLQIPATRHAEFGGSDGLRERMTREELAALSVAIASAAPSYRLRRRQQASAAGVGPCVIRFYCPLPRFPVPPHEAIQDVQ